MSCIAVVDIGKSNVKVALVDTASLREIDVRRTPNVVRPGPPYPHYDTEGHWTFILNSLRELGAGGKVDAISIATHGATAALVDHDGALALPILDYEHKGPEALAAEYDAVRPSFEESGSPRLAAGLNLGAQLFWQLRCFDEARKASHIVTYPQYWAFRLCGVLASEATSLGCHTDLWSTRSGGLSSLVDRMGWTSMLPPLRRAADVLGTLRPEVADAVALDPKTPVICGIHDSNASLYPHMLGRKGAFAVVSTGTWVICMAVRGRSVALDPGRDTLMNVNAVGEPVPSARFMGGREHEVAREGADVTADAEDRRRVLERRVMLLPAVEPATGPFRGRVSRWTATPAGPGERFVALSWYLALMTDTCLSMIGAEGPVVVEGPFARNMNYLEMLSACTGRPVEPVADNVTGTSVGAALLADPKAGATVGTGEPVAPPDPALAEYARRWKREVDGR